MRLKVEISSEHFSRFAQIAVGGKVSSLEEIIWDNVSFFGFHGM